MYDFEGGDRRFKDILKRKEIKTMDDYNDAMLEAYDPIGYSARQRGILEEQRNKTKEEYNAEDELLPLPNTEDTIWLEELILDEDEENLNGTKKKGKETNMRLRKIMAGYFEDNTETHGDIRQEGEDRYKYYHNSYFVIRKNGQAEIVDMNHWKGWSTLDGLFNGKYDHGPINIGGRVGIISLHLDEDQAAECESLKGLNPGDEYLQGVMNEKSIDVAVVDMQGYRKEDAEYICSKL
jgi:hypothetical protein